MDYDVFISYRRSGGYDTAKHLNDLLVIDGYKVSFDIDTLRSGDFDRQLLQRIDQCQDFILIVDPHAFDRTLDPTYPAGNDWLRQELAYALKKGKNVIPIFLSGVTGFPPDLPADVAAVAKKHGPEYSKFYFNDFYKTLKERFMHMHVVTLADTSEDYAINDTSLSAMLLQMFSQSSIADRLQTYLSLDVVIRKFCDREEEEERLVKKLEEIQYLNAAENQRQALVNMLNDFFDAIGATKRLPQLFCRLGQMVCCYILKEYAMVLRQQKEIAGMQFSRSFWEKHGGSIKKVGGMVLGIAGSLLTGANAGGAMNAGYSGGKTSAEQAEQKLKEEIRLFTAMQHLIASLQITYRQGNGKEA